jgi:hypothetical protein
MLTLLMSEWDLACYQRRCDMAKNVVKIIMKGSIDEQNRVMNPVLDITKLTRAEKLRAMEELWEDLSRPEAEYESPEWHGEVLRAREVDVQAGRDEFVPWEAAKQIRGKPITYLNPTEPVAIDDWEVYK